MNVRPVTLALPSPSIVTVHRVEAPSLLLTFAHDETDLQRVVLDLRSRDPETAEALATIVSRSVSGSEQLQLVEQPVAPAREPLDAADVANMLVAAVNERVLVEEDRRARRRWRRLRFTVGALNGLELLELAAA